MSVQGHEQPLRLPAVMATFALKAAITVWRSSTAVRTLTFHLILNHGADLFQELAFIVDFSAQEFGTIAVRIISQLLLVVFNCSNAFGLALAQMIPGSFLFFREGTQYFHLAGLHIDDDVVGMR